MRILKFLLLWFLLAIFFSLVNSSFEPGDVMIQTINALLFTTGYYVSYYFLIKSFLYKNKTGAFIGLYLLFIAVLSMVSMLSTYQVYVFQNKKFFVDNFWNEPVFFTSNYILMLLATSSMLGFRFLKDKIQTEITLKNLEKEKISTELDFLKAQINPHFLFNSLNNILFQIDKTNMNARETLLKFSEMLRYQLYECKSDLIEIEKEAQYIKNYIEIQMLRKTDQYNCYFTVADSVRNFRIAPLLLIPFIENAFKYVSNHSARMNNILISMNYQDGDFVFLISNDKDHLSPVTISENKGIGLSNVRRRLDLLYDKKYKLDIINDEDQYKVNLKIKVS